MHMARPNDFIPRLTTVIVCLLAALGVVPALAQGQTPALVLNTDGAPPHSRPGDTGFEDRIILEAFRRIGVAVRLVRLPSERALKNANQGIDDGSYVRIAGLSAQYPNLVMVPEPMSEFSFTAFTRDPALNVSTWDDLRSRRTGVVTGWKIVEQNLAGGPFLSRARDEEALFALLDRGRVEVVVSSLYSGMEIIRRHRYRNMRALAPPLDVQPMYLYMNKKHADLVPLLDQALRQMRQDGSLKRIMALGLQGIKP